MRVGDLGEFELIGRLQQLIPSERPDVIVGIGDDVAVLSAQGDVLLLATSDSQVEQVHFVRHLIAAEQLGRRALAVNLSDIAAMGGRPSYALISLALPAKTDVAWIEDVYRGMHLEAERAKVAIVGGNVTRSPDVIQIHLTLLGQVRRDHLLLRSGAHPGDRVLVTGWLGDAAAGLRLALDPELPITPSDRETLLSRYCTPTPRLAEAAVIARLGLATAMLDLSDGLSSDIGHICDQSRVGVCLHAADLPILDPARQVAELAELAPWQMALSGGDDYELCFTASPNAVDALVAAVAAETSTPVTVIGEILPDAEMRQLTLPNGQIIPLTSSGWEHFKRHT
ncbi:MAG: thiamine-phosphate kinase [Chloroflexales bacterium]|nr:thiamine-phosphate kinase [Chloroflexales bacterium]